MPSLVMVSWPIYVLYAACFVAAGSVFLVVLGGTRKPSPRPPASLSGINWTGV